MEAISFIALIFLSLIGYSGGVTGKAGKSADLKPQIIDLILVLLIWAGAIYFRISFDLNKWIVILIWIILSSIIGVLITWPRKTSEKKSLRKEELSVDLKNSLKNLWQSWKSFSKRMGSFQSRIILSLFFFIVVSPFALGVKVFSDPLRMKHRSSESHWLIKKEMPFDLEQFRRQF